LISLASKSNGPDPDNLVLYVRCINNKQRGDFNPTPTFKNAGHLIAQKGIFFEKMKGVRRLFPEFTVEIF